MDIQQTPYFAFEVNAWDSWRERISLGSDNIERLLQQLEAGENLFEVVSEMRRNRFDKFSMKYGLFERRNEVTLNDERFVSTQGYKQVGKLLVPDYQIITREEIEDRLDKTGNDMDRRTYSKVLANFPETSKFHYEGSSTYTPLDTNKILVLNKNQL
jgi:hypothetical protein